MIQSATTTGSKPQGQWRRPCAALLAVILAPAAPALADQPSLTLTSDANLRFGSFAAFSSGSRGISPSGGVTDNGIFAVNTSGIGPAQFTISYDRGNNDQRALTIILNLLLTDPGPVSQGGVTGTPSGFTTDLAGPGLITPGQFRVVTLANCTTRICSQSFHIGATLSVSRSSGGAKLSLPLPVSANLVSVL